MGQFECIGEEQNIDNAGHFSAAILLPKSCGPVQGFRAVAHYELYGPMREIIWNDIGLSDGLDTIAFRRL